jgi:hypothetical protein
MAMSNVCSMLDILSRRVYTIFSDAIKLIREPGFCFNPRSSSDSLYNPFRHSTFPLGCVAAIRVPGMVLCSFNAIRWVAANKGSR